MPTVEKGGVADWIVFFGVMRKIYVLNTRRIALILRVMYGINDNTFDKHLFDKSVGVYSI